MGFGRGQDCGVPGDGACVYVGGGWEGALLLSDNLGGLAGDAGVSVFLPENGTLFSVIPTCGTELPHKTSYSFICWVSILAFESTKSPPGIYPVSGTLPDMQKLNFPLEEAPSEVSWKEKGG